MKLLSTACVFVLALGLMTIPTFAQDTDGDGVPDVVDNCPTYPNGPELGSCAGMFYGVVKAMSNLCTSNVECGSNETCDINQGDFNGNGIGDVCECYANSNCDDSVGLSDLIQVKSEF